MPAERKAVPMEAGTGRTILVTGASSGIGLYCAEALKNDGWRVFATARRAEDIGRLRKTGIEAFEMDYTRADTIDACLAEILRRTGYRLDALFNNGAYAQAGAVEDLPTDALRAQFEANFFGWHELTRQIVPVMRSQGAGRIVHCSSILGLLPIKYRGAYTASKHALEGLFGCQRLELAGTGIHVVMIEPGPIESKIASNALPWFERYIDVEKSFHQHAYRKQLERLRAGGTTSSMKLGPQVVYKVLSAALNDKHPAPHYLVTLPAKTGSLMRRLLPARLFYRLIARVG